MIWSPFRSRRIVTPAEAMAAPRRCRRCGRRRDYGSRGMMPSRRRCECCGGTCASCPSSASCAANCCQTYSIVGSGFTGCATCLNYTAIASNEFEANKCFFNYVFQTNSDSGCEVVEGGILGCSFDPSGIDCDWATFGPCTNQWLTIETFDVITKGSCACADLLIALVARKIGTDSEITSQCPDGTWEVYDAYVFNEEGFCFPCSSALGLRDDFLAGTFTVECAD